MQILPINQYDKKIYSTLRYFALIGLLGYLFIGLLGYLFIGLLSFPVYAVEKTKQPPQVLRVSPIIINVLLSPAKTTQHEITVENLTDFPLPLKASLNDFQTTGEEGGYVFEETHTNPLLSWITLSDNDLILGPHEKKTINATITTPKDIPLGGYYGMLFFETVPQTNVPTTTRIVPKIGVLMLANVGVPDPNAKKADILTYTTGFFHQTNKIPLILRVKNVSLHYFTAKPILTISPLLTLPSLRSQPPSPLLLEEKLVFQGSIRRWNQEVTIPDTTPNIYKAHLVLSTGNGQFITEDRYVVILPFAKAAIGLFVFFTLFFILIKRKRFGKAIRALIK